MNANYARRKEPEAVRRALLDNAASIAARDGFAALTIQTVAAAAGVTKGGLFHHFPNKQALVEGMFADRLDKLDVLIDRHMAAEPSAYGAFTRAYIAVVFDREEFGKDSVWAAMAAALAADTVLRELWASWYRARCDRHRETDGDPQLEVVRLAADGAWYAYLIDGPSPMAEAVRHGLEAMTLRVG